MQLHRYDERETLANELAAIVAADLREASQAGTQASLRLSGGSTPRPLFAALRDDASLDWASIQVSLVDDRWLPANHEQSNEAFVRAELMCAGSPAANAKFYALVDAEQPVQHAPQRWATHVDAGLLPSSSALVLGMGGDGHFASLFPGMPGLDDALDIGAEPGYVTALAPAEPRERISMNLAAIALAHKLYLHITGSAKLALLEGAHAGAPEHATLPISSLLAQLGDRLHVFWAP